MEDRSQHSQDRKVSLKKAKRWFLLNILFFGCLISAETFIFTSSDEEAPKPIIAEATPETPILSLTELAYLKGQLLGLSEHPDSMPEYETEELLKISEQRIRRDPAFAEGLKSDIPELTQEFAKGYMEKFEDYYDRRVAREAGYRFGLKYNPLFRDDLLPPSTFETLTQYKDRLMIDYQIPDEASWLLFCLAFQSGFDQGYPITEDGLTVESRHQNINLFDDQAARR